MLLPALLLLSSFARADNVVYLTGAGAGVSQTVLSATAKKATANFAALGLKTTARVLRDKFSKEDYARMAKTDSLAVVGPPADVIALVKTFNPAAAKSLESANFGSNSGSINPEHSINPRDGYGNNLIAVALGATKTFSEACGVKFPEAAAFLIIHGAGHNSNLQHAGDSNGYDPVTGSYKSDGIYMPGTPNIMTDGGVAVRRIQSQAFGEKAGKPKETLASFVASPFNVQPAHKDSIGVNVLSIKAALEARFGKGEPKPILAVLD